MHEGGEWLNNLVDVQENNVDEVDTYQEGVSDVINERLIPDNLPVTLLSWGTSGIGKELSKCMIEEWEEHFLVWGRSKLTLEKASDNTNKELTYVEGDLFSVWSEAYDFYINELPKREGGWTVYFLSAINMDPISIEDDSWILIADWIDPRTSQKWKEWMNKEEKDDIREELVNIQLNFWETFFDSLLDRESDELLTIVHSNWVISQFADNYIIGKHSWYARLKFGITKLIAKKYREFEEKNIIVKDIYIWLVDTKMFTERGQASAIKTGHLLKKLSPNFPINWEKITQDVPLKSWDVADFIYNIWNIPTEDIPNRIILANGKHLDVDGLLFSYKKIKDKLLWLIHKLNIINEKGEIFIDNKIKDFLIWLRICNLDIYYNENKNTWVNKNKLDKKIVSWREILDTLPEKVSLAHFLDICMRFEWNYP